MIHLYWMTWNILSCKISLRYMDKCFSGEWTKMYTSGLWMVFRKQGVTMRAGGLVEPVRTVWLSVVPQPFNAGSRFPPSRPHWDNCGVHPNTIPVPADVMEPPWLLWLCSHHHSDKHRDGDRGNCRLLKYRNILTGKSQKSLLWYKWKMLLPISLFFSINFDEMIDWSVW